MRSPRPVTLPPRGSATPPEETIAVLTALILDRPLCLECISTKSGVSAAEAEPVLQRIGTALKLYREVARCRMCDAVGRVVSVDRPTDTRL